MWALCVFLWPQEERVARKAQQGENRSEKGRGSWRLQGQKCATGELDGVLSTQTGPTAQRHARKREQELVSLKSSSCYGLKGQFGWGQEEVMRWSWELDGSLRRRACLQREKGNSIRKTVTVLDLKVPQAHPAQLFLTSTPLYLHRCCSDCGASDLVIGYLQESRKTVTKFVRKDKELWEFGTVAGSWHYSFKCNFTFSK